jgi:dephospho-CoA kinase
MTGDRAIPFVGLTGGIGVGKSEALAALERLGAATLSSDAVVRELLQTDEMRDKIVERFGPDVAPEGEIDRSALAERAFGRDEDREWLENALWPRVGERIAAWREELAARDPRPKAAVVEVPLLFESGMDAVFDHTIAVIADEQVAARRAGERGHAAVASRSARHMSQAEKAQRADFVARNDGSLDELQQEMERLLANIGA